MEGCVVDEGGGVWSQPFESVHIVFAGCFLWDNGGCWGLCLFHQEIIIMKSPIRSLVPVAGVFAAVSFAPLGAQSADPKKPNLIIVQTDEHSFRTLGCYRKHLSEAMAHVWGEGVEVKTPHIDSLAKDGAIFTQFYAASPVCTPSRASLMSGMYPQATGAWKNNLPLHDHLVSFASILEGQGYATAYLGKWHLDGDAKPGFAPKRKFGFTDNRYMFNRGHWKKIEGTPESGMIVDGGLKIGKLDVSKLDANHFTTDFLVSRTLEVIERDRGKPFCIMVSIPDPHGPNKVRAPYDRMFDHFTFKKPHSMIRTLADPSMKPKWATVKGSNWVEKISQQDFRSYFGMVKCIDDNIGRLLGRLEEHGLTRDTVVVFTSDHGDMLCEHCRKNKGLPYETSAKIPFVVRYPAKVPAGKVIKTAHTTVDFAPTMLGLMGVDGELPDFHGHDSSGHCLSEEKVVRSDRVVYIRNSGGGWVAAIDDRHKLVLSQTDEPWLFDLEKDPNELENFHGKPGYEEATQRLTKELQRQMKLYAEPALKTGKLRGL